MPRSKQQIPEPYKSNYEYNQAQKLEEAGINFEYEAHSLGYYDSVTNGVCLDCNSSNLGVRRSYTPDFYFPESNLYVETKGKFDRDNRRKMIAICEESDVEIRMVFMRDNWLTRKHGLKYSTWCERYNIAYAIVDIPLKWVKKDKIK
jgi:hypothetical protein